MKMRILNEAAAELADAIDRYEWIEPGLGRRMQDEVGGAFAWIAANPELPRLRPKGYRRVFLRVMVGRGGLAAPTLAGLKLRLNYRLN